MRIRTLSIQDSAKIYQEWIDNNTLPKIENGFSLSNEYEQEYKDLRNFIYNNYLPLKRELVAGNIKPYDLDYKLSLCFYDYISSQSWFNSRIAANEDFWRFISMKIIPDIISSRFDQLDKRHFYSKGTRVYPYTLYWYTYLSWQDSLEKTESVVESSRFSTDTIVGLVERTGRNGTFIILYRKIMGYFATFETAIKLDYISLFRSVMKLCMAKTQVIDPDLCDGGPNKYAQILINECIKKRS